MTVVVEYNSNNSGGDWWLKDDDWHALEKAGWKVDWFKDQDRDFFEPDADGRWLGALAKEASKEFPTLKDGIREWERLTSQNATALGCFSCCGPPHYFTARDPSTGKHVDDYSPDAPMFGDPYD